MLYLGHVFPSQYSCKLYNDESVRIFPGALTGAFLLGFAGFAGFPVGCRNQAIGLIERCEWSREQAQ